MSCRMGLICAAAFVCVVAGCVENSFLASHGKARMESWTVNEHYKTVAAVLNAGLSDQVMQLKTRALKSEERLAGQTKSGKVFCLYVRPHKSDYEKAVVSLYWDRESDPQFRQIVLEVMTPPAKEGAEAAATKVAE